MKDQVGIKKIKELRFAIVTLAPLLVFVWLWIAYPISYAVFHSFHAYDITRPWYVGRFIGLDNYIGVFTSYYFIKSLITTAIFIVVVVPVVIGLSLGIALILNQNVPGSRVMQVFVLVPWAIPYVVTGTMFKWIYDANYGILNYVLVKLNIISEYQPWLTMPWHALMLLSLGWIWSQYPLPTILFLARLKLMPTDIYEASIIDGANAFNRFRFITLTWLRPILLLNIIYQTIIALATFDLIYVITGGGPFDFTSTISFFTYREAFQFFDWGRAISLAVSLFLIGLSIVYLYMKALPSVRYR
ncbi:MAG: sugar ABC transporter permease [Nitrososphaerota archaeon]